MTILKAAADLYQGSLAFYMSITAKSSYNGVLTAFLILSFAAIDWPRCFYIRFYQAILCVRITI